MTVIQCPFVKFHVHDDNGYPASGWRLYTFKAGTDDPLSAYKDAAGTVEYGAYALLNSRGEPDGDGFFLAEGMAYKLVLKRPDGSTAWSEPYVLPSATGIGTSGSTVIAARSVLGNASASPADAVAVPIADTIADEPNAVPSAKAVFEAIQTVEAEMVRNHGEQSIDGSLAVSGALSAGSLSVGGEDIDDRYIRKSGHAGLSLVGRSEGGVGAVSDVPMVEALTSESDRSGIPNAGAVLDALDDADTGMARVTANDSKGFLAGKIVGDGATTNVAPNAEGTKLVVSVNQDLVNRIGAHEGQSMVDAADSLGYLGEKFEFGDGLSGGVTDGKKIRIQNNAPDTLQTKAHSLSTIPGFLSALAVAGTGINIALSADMEKLVFSATGSAVGGFYWKGTWDSEGTYNANNAVWYFDHTGELPISRLYIATTQNQGVNPLADAGIGTGTCWSCMMAVDYMGDQFVMLDATDTQAGYLADKLKAGNYVTLTRNADAGGAWYTIDTVAPYQVSIGGVFKDYNQLYGVLEFVGAGGCTAEWNGRAIQIRGLALGTTSTTAARGDQGLTAYNHSQAAHAPSNADNTQGALNAGASKTTPVDADTLPLLDSAASSAIKKLSWANVKATLKAYFDGVYATATAVSGKVAQIAKGGALNYAAESTARWRGIAHIDAVAQGNGGVAHIIVSTRFCHADIYIGFEGGESYVILRQSVVNWEGTYKPDIRTKVNGYSIYVYMFDPFMETQVSIMRMEISCCSLATIAPLNYNSTVDPGAIVSSAFCKYAKLSYVDSLTSDAQTQINGKAPTSHTHGNLTPDGKLGSTSGLPVVTTTSGEITAVAWGTGNPVMNGTASPGTSTVPSRGDHVHPVDTSRLAIGSGLSAGASVVVRAYNSGNTYSSNVIYLET